MKILVLANKLPFPPRDGGSIATMNMLLGLRQAGNQVTCLAMNTSKHPFPVEQIPQELHQKIRFLAVDVDTSIKPSRLLINLLFSREPYIAERFRSRAYSLELQALLAQESFDIVQIEGPLSVFLPWAGQERKQGQHLPFAPTMQSTKSGKEWLNRNILPLKDGI
jgi:hypothetical protein